MARPSSTTSCHRPPPFDDEHAAALELAADAWLVTAFAPCAPILRAVLDSAAAASSHG